MENLISFIPEKYRATCLFALALSPYVTRTFHALKTGGGLRGVIGAIWLGTNQPTQSPGQSQPVPIKTVGGSLALILALVATTLAGCQSSPQRQAFNVESGAAISVDAAMSAWGDYVQQFHPPAFQELRVRALYEKYQSAALAVIDVSALASNLNSVDAATQRQAAEQEAAQCLADLVSAIRTFGGPNLKL